MRCRLCLCEAKLQNSHILPEWTFKPIYNAKHQFVEIVSTKPGETKTHQKGVREHLLCTSSEGKRAQWEDYASRVLYAPPTMNTGLSFGRDAHKVIVEGVDYGKFKLFQLSILWMSSITSIPVFSSVSLGAEHEENLRRMLYNADPGTEQQYGCLIELLMESDRKTLDNFIMGLTSVRFAGHTWHRFIFAGTKWSFIVSIHEQTFPQTTGLILKSGKITMRAVPAEKPSKP